LRGIYTIWLREMMRYSREKSRVVSSLAMPLFFLFFIGSGLNTAFTADRYNVNYLQFMFPGILAMSLLFTSIGSGLSVIWDREFGFMREILVAPIRRTSVVVGKILGGTSVAMIQGSLLLLAAPLLGLSVPLAAVPAILGTMALISSGIVGLGLLIAALSESFEGHSIIMSFIVMPMFILSGAFFPIEQLPSWLGALVALDPLSYGVDLLRHLILGKGANSIALNVGAMACFSVATIAACTRAFGREF
jgi:ABC-2 type transport system permease protein